ncbi:MAG: hypothetical protein H8E55_61940 [Pelagibacterales bacterium]|nr:hypothetical protein [Pelagibacterales bacterium]
MFIRSYKFFLIFFLITSCEKDDICLEGSANTNRITIGFINSENESFTSLSITNIRGINKDSIIYEDINTHQLKLPLNISSNKTDYILNYNEIDDTLSIKYIAIHSYLNRGCGFISNFVLDSSTENIDNNYGWIKKVSIVKDSIFNEEKTNLYIHF